MKARRSAPAIAIALLLSGCASAPAPPTRPFPPVRFAVLSDIHLYDTSISQPGPAFEREVQRGPVLYAESTRILERALGDVAQEHPAFVLVCGDLSKDGERASHELAARLLSGLAQRGIAVLVVPGNHDVSNPHAVRYAGDASEPVASVTAEEFASIYGRMGYEAAIDRDPVSLSYVSEPVSGLRVIALDSSRGYPDRRGPETPGRLSAGTMRWLQKALDRSQADSKAAIVFLHHGLLERFHGMRRVLGRSLLEGRAQVIRLLAQGGARLVFTGHGHAQDAVQAMTPWGKLWDVETGSLASYPDPWRMVEIDDEGIVRISARRVGSLPDSTSDFAVYAESRLRGALEREAARLLQQRGVAEGPAQTIARRTAEAGLRFFAGDEPGPPAPIDRTGMGAWASLVAAVADGIIADLGRDLPPADNDLAFEY